MGGAGSSLTRNPQALIKEVDGAQKAEVSYEKREAVVTFDDAKTSVEALTRATESAGYPSSVRIDLVDKNTRLLYA